MTNTPDSPPVEGGPQREVAISCHEVVELVTEYLEGQLDDVTRAEVEAHLAGCPGCETYLAQMRLTIAELGQVPVEALGERTKADLLAAFRDFRVRRAGDGEG